MDHLNRSIIASFGVHLFPADRFRFVNQITARLSIDCAFILEISEQAAALTALKNGRASKPVR